jgi:hypothetical protein
VIIPAPYWVSYPDMVLIADATPVCIECPQSQGYKITAAQLEKAITANTKLLVLNSPVQPDRHGLQQGRTAGAGRGAAQAPASADRHR